MKHFFLNCRYNKKMSENYLKYIENEVGFNFKFLRMSIVSLLCKK